MYVVSGMYQPTSRADHMCISEYSSEETGIPYMCSYGLQKVFVTSIVVHVYYACMKLRLLSYHVGSELAPTPLLASMHI
jgi:hypothetical protein